MPWGRCDDGWWRHPKVLALRDTIRLEAGGLYWSAISWSNDSLADGAVPMSAVRILSGRRGTADELVRVGLWEGDARTGYRIHDYLDFNQSREQILAARAKWAEAKAHQRGKSTTDKDSDTPPDSGADSTPDRPPDTGPDSLADAATDSAEDSRAHVRERITRPARSPVLPFSRTGDSDRRSSGSAGLARIGDILPTALRAATTTDEIR